MNPGALRQKVTLQARGPAASGTLGTHAGVWADVATLWAEIEPLEGSEAVRAMQQGIRQPHRIKIRWRDGVSAAHRFRYGTRVFNIRGITDVEMRHRELVLIAEEVTPS